MIDVKKGRVAETPERRWSTSKLNSNELMLLLGLIVQSPTDQSYNVIVEGDTFEREADKLLREFHDRLLFLLCHKSSCLFRVFFRAQQGHRDRLVTSATIKRRRMVAIEFGM